MRAASNIIELIRFIGANSSREHILVEIKTQDGRVVIGSSYQGSKRPMVVSVKTPCIDSNLLRSQVEALLKTGKSFIVRNGQISDACPFEWTISDN